MNSNYEFLNHCCTTTDLEGVIGYQDWFGETPIILYNHDMRKPLAKNASTLDHWVALEPIAQGLESYADKAVNLLVEMECEKSKAQNYVLDQPSAPSNQSTTTAQHNNLRKKKLSEIYVGS
jgi:hypothetical protein